MTTITIASLREILDRAATKVGENTQICFFAAEDFHNFSEGYHIPGTPDVDGTSTKIEIAKVNGSMDCLKGNSNETVDPVLYIGLG